MEIASDGGYLRHKELDLKASGVNKIEGCEDMMVF